MYNFNINYEADCKAWNILIEGSGLGAVKISLCFYKPAVFWFFVALLFRIIALCFIYFHSIYIGREGFYPLATGYDDEHYFQSALKIIKGERPEVPNTYPYFLAFIFKLVGNHVFFGQLVNVFISAASVFVGVLLARELFSSKNLSIMSIKHPANISGMLLSFYPFSVFYSTQLIRDSIILFLGILNIFFIVRLLKWKKTIDWFLLILCMLMLYVIRPYTAIFIIFSFVLYYFFFVKKGINRKVHAIIIMFPVAAFVPYFAGYGIFGLSYIKPLLSLERLIAFRERAYSIGGSSVGIDLDLSNPVSFAGSYLYSYLTVLLGPFPWQIKSTVHLFALPEAMFFWVLFPLWIKLLISLFRGRMQYEGFLLLFSLLMIAGVAIFSDNVGANTRLRLLPIAVLLILSSGYISRRLTKQNSGG